MGLLCWGEGDNVEVISLKWGRWGWGLQFGAPASLELFSNLWAKRMFSGTGKGNDRDIIASWVSGSTQGPDREGGDKVALERRRPGRRACRDLGQDSCRNWTLGKPAKGE